MVRIPWGRRSNASNAYWCYRRCVARIPGLTAPEPRLDVRDLRLVLALVAAGSTAKAAAMLHLTQSAVSRALLLAEDKIGVPLFERTRRGLSPTPAGSRLVAGAGPLLAELAALEERVGTPDRAPVRIRLVCECYTAYRWLPSALIGLRRSLPEVEVVLAVEHTSAPVDALRSGEIDIALLTTSAVRAPLEERQLFADEIVFVVSTTHPLANRKSITRRDLCEYPLLNSDTPVAATRWFAGRVFGKTRPQLRVVRLPLTEAIIDLTRAGLGIAILSEWIAGPYLAEGGLVIKRLASGPLRRPWRVAYRREVADVATRLVAAIEGSAPRACLASAG
jgi:LysR family transcriptional regulator for metE and metH